MRSARGDATREHIIETATQMFASSGYEAVSVAALLLECGISRGALYHHFSGKQAVFEAVLEGAEAKVAETLLQAAQNGDNALGALQAGCREWLNLAARDPVIRQIVLIDAPAVVGWQAWREIDERYALGLLQLGIAQLAGDTALAETGQVTMRAHALLAVLVEMALIIARSPDDDATFDTATDIVELLLDRITAMPASP